MYETFFGFKEKPFDLTPDPKFFYYSKKHREALAQLIYGVKERRGFVVLSGELGTGKTTIVKALVERLDESCNVAYLLEPRLPITGFLRRVCDDFGLDVDSDSKIDYLIKLHDFLLDSHEDNKTTTLVVDEAQTLNAPMFEEIRMLTNLETSSQKLLQIILVGQSELDDLLDRGELWQLKQRISTRYHLLPLECQETKEYIQTRMSIAGAKNLNCFTADAIQKIYKYSRGIPGLINLICDKSLSLGYARHTLFIDEEVVQKSVADLELDRVSKRHKPRVQKGEFFFAGRSFSYAPVILILIFLAFVVSGTGYFLKARLRFSEDRTPSKSFSQGKQIEAVHLRPDQKERTTEEGEGVGHLPQSKTGVAVGSLVPGVVPMRDSEAEEAAGLAELGIPPTLGDRKAVKSPTATAGRGDTVRAIILREFGRVDEQLLNVVRELNPQIEDLNQIGVGQVIRLPKNQRHIALVLEEKGRREGEGTLTTQDESLRAEETILVELGEIQRPEKKTEEGGSPEKSLVDRLMKPKEKEALEPFPAETLEGTSEKLKESSGEVSVGVSDDVQEPSARRSEGEAETGEEPPVGEELEKVEERELAKVGHETMKESLDAKAMEEAGGESLEEMREGVGEKGREAGRSLVAAEEEEVKQFFAYYVERYTRKDLDGFLSLFSPKAVQNGTDGLHKIRKIYSDFFNQSQELRYHLEDTRIQIYQNAVEARARYQVDQILKKGRKKKVWKGDVHWVLVRENGALRIVSLDYQNY